LINSPASEQAGEGEDNSDRLDMSLFTTAPE
jgi:hypothetical protein